ncbi:hypothetical protein NP493_1325g01034 [Ridgeia piscesae]|uniref:DAGKc domain-containing protein n=1 Tax=Ridgeia piscesae TaxID=27915 RepID=A0AAD9NDU5_RIDPI|nr:hypothetical protein NP493_1325g01034 [Ridgeia piscesae]
MFMVIWCYNLISKCVSTTLVFNWKSSCHSKGIKMLRKFKQLLNPAQVFDLMNGGPKAGLRLFQTFESFRVIVAGGDGSIGWVLNEIDHLGLQKEASYQTNLSPSSPK